MSFNVENFRKNFPQLERTAGPRKLIYLDSGASSLKHSAVTDRVNTFNRFETANVHRGAHQVSSQGTENYEMARNQLQRFVNARLSSEVIFTRGTTEGINFMATGLEPQLKAGDEILITALEHHSNIVPWQVLCQKTGAVLKVVPFDAERGFSLESFDKCLTEKTKVAAFIFYSNSFGQRLPVESMVEKCRKRGVISVVDAAQAVLTEKIDVQKINCDALVFSGHKMFAPYGIGVLYLKESMQECVLPYQTGGSMIDRVSFKETSYADAPQKYEAGTPNIAGAIGLGVASQLVSPIIDDMHDHVDRLRQSLIANLSSRSSLDLYDFPGERHTGVVSFNIKDTHPSDVGTLLDKYGIAVRAGHHCTQPLMELMKIPGTVRVSLAAYNTESEISSLLETLDKIEEFF